MPRSGHAASEVETERMIKREIRALL
jgi:hypothetical protein